MEDKADRKMQKSSASTFDDEELRDDDEEREIDSDCDYCVCEREREMASFDVT